MEDNDYKQKIKIGDTVEFYDSDTANRERDFSGENPKHYITGEVVYTYEEVSHFGKYRNELCDIKTHDGRISKGHFISDVKLTTN
jgi:hypothetical protein